VVLVDTSVWIEVFRKPAGIDLEAVVDLEEVVTCLPVVQEVLQGFREQRHFELAREAMSNLPIVESPMRASVFDEAVDLFRAARRQGVTVRSGVDCLIAACALRNGLTVLHHDRDFDRLARIAALDVRSITPRSSSLNAPRRQKLHRQGK
jgi:predicted nucleic acid-binding protein